MVRLACSGGRGLSAPCAAAPVCGCARGRAVRAAALPGRGRRRGRGRGRSARQPGACGPQGLRAGAKEARRARRVQVPVQPFTWRHPPTAPLPSPYQWPCSFGVSGTRWGLESSKRKGLFIKTPSSLWKRRDQTLFVPRSERLTFGVHSWKCFSFYCCPPCRCLVGPI